MEYSYLRFPGFKIKAVTLSYDDATIYDEKLIEILNKYGLKCTFNINSGILGVSERFLNKDQAVKLYKDTPHEVAVHGAVHHALETLPTTAQICWEITSDRHELEKMFGRIVNGMAYANGTYDAQAVETLKYCGIKYARTIEKDKSFALPADWLRMPATCHHADPELMTLAQKFLELKLQRRFVCRQPYLFYLWGHSYEFNDSNNWHVIEDFCKLMGGRDDVFYCTNGELFEYVTAFNNLVYSVDGKWVHNPSAIDVYLDYLGKERLVKSNQTINLGEE